MLVILITSFIAKPSKKNKPSGILILANKISLIPGILDMKGTLSKIKFKPNKISNVLIAISGWIIIEVI
jgi:hypothetical protein